MSLPESWVEVFLPQICELIGGGTPERSKADYFGGSIPWVTPSDVTKLDGFILDVTQVTLTDEGLKASPAKVVPAGSVLMATRVAVGKAVIAAQNMATNQDFTSLVIDRSIVASEYLVRAIVSRAGLLESQSQGSTIKGIPRSTVARLKIPLPTLPEQQRIVDVLRQTECLSKNRSDTHATIDVLTREYYAKLFGDVFINDKSWSTAKLGRISDIVRGSSPRPQGDPRLFGGTVPRLMVSDLTRDGLWVDATTDSLTVEGAKSSRPMPAQSVVMAVSGAPGLTAILNHDACIHDGFVGLRDLHTDLLPEFVAFTLNLLRAKNDQQAVGAVFRNLTTDQVKAISIPLPPIELQQQFQAFLLQVKKVQHKIDRSDEILRQLMYTVSIEAFSGELTANWRDAQQVQIKTAVIERDTNLHKRRAKVKIRFTETAPAERTTKIPRPARLWLTNELSEFQHEVWNTLRYEWRGSVIVDDPEVFGEFCTSQQTAWRIEHFKASPNRIRRTLEQLAALGLIAKISVPKLNPLTQQTEYLTTFRPLREEENTRLADANLMRRALSLESSGAKE